MLLAFGLGAAASAQNLSQDELRSRIEGRYTVLPIQDGIVLAPRTKGSVLTIEIAGNTIAVNGTEVTGGELRDRLGNDDDAVAILQLSYLTPAARQSLFKLGGQGDLPQISPVPRPDDSQVRRTRRRGALVRIGGSAAVERDEIVDDDVVVVGGSARVDGQVNGEVVVVGGSLSLGPEANISGDVTVVGGTLSRAPGATIGGEVNNVAIGPNFSLGPMFGNQRGFWRSMPFVGIAGTAMRGILLLLFGWIIMLLASGPVQRIGERAAADPVKAGFVGLLAEALFLPVLIMTIVLLVITIVGIPLLALVPFAVLALVVVFLVGFTGVAARIGRWVADRFGWTNAGPYLAATIGIVIILTPLLCARALGLVGMNFIGFPILATAVLVEYLAWTIGFGAAALTYLSPARETSAPLAPAPPAAGDQVMG
jgi:hypothetical protein